MGDSTILRAVWQISGAVYSAVVPSEAAEGTVVWKVCFKQAPSTSFIKTYVETSNRLISKEGIKHWDGMTLLPTLLKHPAGFEGFL